MATNRTFRPLVVTSSLLGVAYLCTVCAFGAGIEAPSQATQAASVLGGGEGAVVTLVRELTEWRDRALAAEARLNATLPEPFPTAAGVSAPRVLGSLEGERMVILSFGRASGATQGALVSVGNGLVAKVVESRDTVSAALVENSFKGKVSSLEGLPVKLAVR